jgi:hypothetical protein
MRIMRVRGRKRASDAVQVNRGRARWVDAFLSRDLLVRDCDLRRRGDARPAKKSFSR